MMSGFAYRVAYGTLTSLMAMLVSLVDIASAAPVVPPPPKPPAATKAGGGTKERLQIRADYMKYDRKAKLALANGNVEILQSHTRILTSELQFDQAKKVSYMNQPVHLVQQKKSEPKSQLWSQRMVNFHREKRLLADGKVRFLRSKDPKAKSNGSASKDKVQAAVKKVDTLITAEHLEYWTEKKDALFRDQVVVVNDKKKVYGDQAFLNQAADTITLDGNVKLLQMDGQWLIDEDIVKNDPPDDTRDEALREQAVITADRMVINQRTNDAVATGKVVRVEQKGKVATSRKAVFSDANNIITMTDQVRIQQASGDWLTASKAIFHTDTEVFEAFSGGTIQVQTEFNLPEDTDKGGKP